MVQVRAHVPPPCREFGEALDEGDVRMSWQQKGDIKPILTQLVKHQTGAIVKKKGKTASNKSVLFSPREFFSGKRVPNNVELFTES